MWWLRLRESSSDRPSRVVVWVMLFLAWTLLLAAGSLLAADADATQLREDLATIAKITWPLWALIPLLSGGAGEVTSSARLAPYPVAPRTHLYAAWVSALLDYPYLVAFPPMLALTVGVAGWWGVPLGVLYVLSASAAGQAGAWVLARLVGSRSRPGLLVAGLTLAGVVVVAAWSLLAPVFAGVASSLPGLWLASAAGAAADGEALPALLWSVLLLVPVLLHARFGTFLVSRALDVERHARGVPSRPWGDVSWAGRGSVERVLLATHLRSVLRATSTQAALAGVVLTPFLFRFLAGNSPDAAIGTIALIAVLSAAATLGVNSFGYLSGGMVWVLSAPVSRWRLVGMTSLALALLLTGIGLLALGVAFLLLSPSLGASLAAVVSVVLRSVVLAAICVRWSVRHPVAVDFDSLRNKVTTPRAAFTFFAAGVSWGLLVTFPLGVSALPLGLRLLASSALTVLVAFVYLWRSVRDLSREGEARVVSAVTE